MAFKGQRDILSNRKVSDMKVVVFMFRRGDQDVLGCRREIVRSRPGHLVLARCRFSIYQELYDIEGRWLSTDYGDSAGVVIEVECCRHEPLPSGFRGRSCSRHVRPKHAEGRDGTGTQEVYMHSKLPDKRQLAHHIEAIFDELYTYLRQEII